ncbi:MAG: RluA family pseudouridine synthase [Clostridiaceae bacterium]
MNSFYYSVLEGNVGKRLDVFLTEKQEDKSRSYIQNIIDQGNVEVNNKKEKTGYKIKLNDQVELCIPEVKSLNVDAEDIPLDIIYEDGEVIVINKKQGMVVHPAVGNYSGTLVNALLNHCNDLSGINGITRPGIVHRIDKDTSGILVVAKNDFSHNKLAAQLKEHTMNRVYYCLVHGNIKVESGIVDKPLGRHKTERKKMAIIDNGKRAVTHYRVLERLNGYSYIECILETGRTHQIRVHMASLGHPIVGDKVYGYKKEKFKLNGQMLHAKILGFIHPKTGEYMEFNCELPSYFKEILKKLENDLK